MPSTTFIERLILGLSKSNQKIILVGKQYKSVEYPKGIYIRTYRNRLGLLRKSLKNQLLVSKSARRIIKQETEGKQLFVKLKTWAIAGELIRQKCQVFHVQWAKDLDNWMFLQKLGIKIFLSLRGAHINYSPIANLELAKNYEKNFPRVDGFHAVSEAIKREAINYGAEEQKIKVVYSGLNLDDFDFKVNRNRNKQQVFKIISVGRPHWKKGYNLALDAISNIISKHDIDIEYTIVGGINEELLYQINDLELNDIVKIIDKVSFYKVKELIRNSDLLLLPSVEEGIANVVLESMAIGTLVLSSNCGGMSEVIKDGVNGFLFENRHVESLQIKLEETINILSGKYIEITQKANSTIEQKHNVKSMIDGFNELYKSVI